MSFLRKIWFINHSLTRVKTSCPILYRISNIQRHDQCYSSNILNRHIDAQLINVNKYITNYVPSRTKTNKRKRRKAGEDDEDSDDEADDISDFSEPGDDKNVVQFKVTSLRSDVIIKRALNIARSKIEEKFYDSQIRINGKKIAKKSISVREGDEIDVIKGLSPQNPNNLVISRVEILTTTPKNDGINVACRRFKSFTIENYEGANEYKSAS